MEDLVLRLDQLLLVAKELLQRCSSLSHVQGMSKLHRKCQAELQFLNKIKQKKVALKESHLQSSNLRHLQAILESAEKLPGVEKVLQPFHMTANSPPLVVDLVCNHGYVWVKVIARKAQALHLVWAGGGQFGERSIVDQAIQHREYAQANLHNFKCPQVLFMFFNGVTAPLRDALLAEGVQVQAVIHSVDPEISDKLGNTSYTAHDHDINELSTACDETNTCDDIDGIKCFSKTPEIDTAGKDTCIPKQGAFSSDKNSGPKKSSCVSSIDGGKPCDVSGCYISKSGEMEISMCSRVSQPPDDSGQVDSSLAEVALGSDSQVKKTGILQAEAWPRTFFQMVPGNSAEIPFKRSFPAKDAVEPCSSGNVVTGSSKRQTNIDLGRQQQNKNSDSEETGYDSDSIVSAGTSLDSVIPLSTYQQEIHVISQKMDSDDLVPGAKSEQERSRLSLAMLGCHFLGPASCTTQPDATEDIKNDKERSPKSVVAVCKYKPDSQSDSKSDVLIPQFFQPHLTIPQPAVLRVNLDVTSLISLVSNLCHGRCNFEFVEDILSQQAVEERAQPLLPRLQHFMQGKELVACDTAVREFQTILHTVGGTAECARAEHLLSTVRTVPDQPSQRSQALHPSAKVKHRAKVIFGTGDQLEAITMTANVGFVRAAANQGVSFSTFIHEPRALTEQKEATARPILLQITEK